MTVNYREVERTVEFDDIDLHTLLDVDLDRRESTIKKGILAHLVEDALGCTPKGV